MQVFVSLYQLFFVEKLVDVCLLFYILVYVVDLYCILCEVDWVLIDDGWLVISNFNFMSFLGVGKLVLLLCQW